VKIKGRFIALATTCLAFGCASHLPSSAAPEHLLATHGTVTIETIRQGKGPVIVLLPSLGRGAGDFDEVAAYLERDGFTIFRPQPRGIGASVGPLNDVNMHDFAADVAAVLDEQKTGSVVVVGHAWGSQPARMLAVDRPDLVRGLVMAAASAGKLPPGSNEKPYGRLRDAIDGSGNLSLPEAQRLKYLQQAFFAPGHDARPWLRGWYPATHEAEAHARNVTPVDAYFAGGTVPILDLQGQYDAVVVPNVFKPMLGDRVTVEVVSNAGHAMAPEQPQAMSDAIARFAHQMYRQ
jgi:pimeloyl-ACP methyl ester carboxylesterase